MRPFHNTYPRKIMESFGDDVEWSLWWRPKGVANLKNNHDITEKQPSAFGTGPHTPPCWKPAVGNLSPVGIHYRTRPTVESYWQPEFH